MFSFRHQAIKARQFERVCTSDNHCMRCSKDTIFCCVKLLLKSSLCLQKKKSSSRDIQVCSPMSLFTDYKNETRCFVFLSSQGSFCICFPTLLKAGSATHCGLCVCWFSMFFEVVWFLAFLWHAVPALMSNNPPGVTFKFIYNNTALCFISFLPLTISRVLSVFCCDVIVNEEFVSPLINLSC